MLGTYLGRVYDEVRGRPRYILRDTIERPSAAACPETALPICESIPASAQSSAVTA